MKYIVVVADSSNDLANQVNERIHLGWQPLGGLAIGLPASVTWSPAAFASGAANKLIFCQAMTKE